MLLELFTSREIALFIWLVIVFILVLTIKKVRYPFKNAIKSFLTKKIIIPLLLLMTYTFCFALLFSKLKFWEHIYIKDITLWMLFIGLPLFYGSILKNININYYKKYLKDSLKFILILELIISTFTFNIVIELIIIPLITLLAMIEVVANSKETTKSAGKLASRLLATIGFIILGFSIRNAIRDFQTLNTFQTIVSLLLPLILTLLYIPVTYLFSIYAKYDTIFLRISIYETNNKVKRTHRRKIFFKCKLSYKKLILFEDIGYRDMYINMPEEEFNNIIKSIKVKKKEVRKMKEKNQIGKFIILSIVMLIIGYTIGFYKGERLYSYIVTPFSNTNGEFDYSIMWTAIAGLGTFFLGATAIYQNRKLHSLEKQTFLSTYYTSLIPNKVEITNDNVSDINISKLIDESHSKYYYHIIIGFTNKKEIPPNIWEIHTFSFKLTNADSKKITINSNIISSEFTYINDQNVIDFYIGVKSQIIDLSKIDMLFFDFKYTNNFNLTTTNDFAIKLNYDNNDNTTYHYNCKQYGNYINRIEA